MRFRLESIAPRLAKARDQHEQMVAARGFGVRAAVFLRILRRACAAWPRRRPRRRPLPGS